MVRQVTIAAKHSEAGVRRCKVGVERGVSRVSLVECRVERGCEAGCEVSAKRVQM